VTAALCFEFGENWAKFLENVDDVRIGVAEQSVQHLVGRDSYCPSVLSISRNFLDSEVVMFGDLT